MTFFGSIKRYYTIIIVQNFKIFKPKEQICWIFNIILTIWWKFKIFNLKICSLLKLRHRTNTYFFEFENYFTPMKLHFAYLRTQLVRSRKFQKCRIDIKLFFLGLFLLLIPNLTSESQKILALSREIRSRSNFAKIWRTLSWTKITKKMPKI